MRISRLLFSLFVCGVAVVGWLCLGVFSSNRDDASRLPLKVPLEETRGEVEKESSRRLGSAASSTSDALPPKPQSQRFEVHGNVRGVQGPVPKATIYARLIFLGDTPESEKNSLQSVEADEKGSYRFNFSDGVLPYRLDLGAVANGFLPSIVRNIEVGNEPFEYDFLLERGDRISGRVLTTDGDPVTDLKLLATRRNMPHLEQPYMTQFLLSRKPPSPPWESDYYESDTITDSNGFFEFTGLGLGKYFLLADSFVWLLPPSFQAEVGESNLLLTAVQSMGVVGTVKDAVTHAPILDCFVDVAVFSASETGGLRTYTRTGAGVDGKIGLAWVNPTPAIEEIRYVVTITAEGYATYRFEKDALTTDGLLTVQAELTPRSPVDIRLQVKRADGVWYEGDLIVQYRESSTYAIEAVQAIKEGPPGMYRAAVPVGEWAVQVMPPFMGHLVAWQEDVDVVANMTLQATLRETGEVIVKRPISSLEDDWTLMVSGCNSSGEVPFPEQTVTLVLPPGIWTIELIHDKATIKSEKVELSLNDHREFDFSEFR